MKHWETHPQEVEGCKPCKWTTIGLATGQFTLERKGEAAMGDNGTRAYVEHMFEQRRSAGLSDPIPTDDNNGKFAPAIGVHGGKKYRKANAGL